MNNLKSDMSVIGMLTYRDIKIFLKDKANVFFSMLAPLIVLLLYVLFLKRVQLDGMISMFSDFGMTKVDKKLMAGFLDGWLISGMLSIGCITVSLSANMVRVTDKMRGIVNDIIVSPVKQHLVKISYYLFNFLVTMIIMTIVFFISLIYIAISGTWHIGVDMVFAVYGTLVFSVLSATFFTSFITDFCKSEATLSALVGITSAMIGFIMGAYVPLSQMPEAIQYIAGLFPGTHSAGMMREFLMTGPLEALCASFPEYVPAESIEKGLADAYCLKVNFFGEKISSGYMAIYIGVTTILLFALNMLVHNKKSLRTDSKKRVKSSK